MAHLNKKCLCCQTRYSHCPDCSRTDALKPSWASEFCSEPCMTIWTTLTKWNMQMIDKAEAKDIISKLNLNPIDTYADCVQRDYAKLMVEDKKPKRGKRVKAKPIDEQMDITQETVESVLEIEQPKEVVEPVVLESTAHEVVTQENE